MPDMVPASTHPPTHTHTHCGWTKSCTTFEAIGTTVCWYLHGVRGSRVSSAVRWMNFVHAPDASDKTEAGGEAGAGGAELDGRAPESLGFGPGLGFVPGSEPATRFSLVSFFG